ncbi:hypothetical protein AOY38_05135 [Synechocystis sp. PCC 6803]|nr:hypothetical protein AOY38_05135 [Synechocystis sp. PCC 6803]
MFTFEVSQLMGHHRLNFRRSQHIHQGSVHHHERLFTSHGKSVGIGLGILLNVEFRRFQVENFASIQKQLMKMG